MCTINLQKTIASYIEEIENLIDKYIEAGNCITINVILKTNDGAKPYDNIAIDSHTKLKEIDSLIQSLFSDIWREIGAVYDEWIKNEKVKQQKVCTSEDATFECNQSQLLQKQIEGGLSQYETEKAKYDALIEISQLFGAKSITSLDPCLTAQADTTAIGSATELPQV